MRIDFREIVGELMARSREYDSRRADFVREHGKCMVCDGTLWLRRKDNQVITQLHCHEILRGINRQKSIEEGPVLWLVTCNLCHDKYLDSRAEMPLARQLALRLKSCQDFTAEQMIQAVRRVRNNGRDPVVIEVSEIEDELKRLEGADART